MRLYIANISDVGLEDVRLLSDSRAKRVERLKMLNDKLRCIAGGLLIRHFLGNTKVTKNQFGKPIAEDGRGFNLSHSGKYVLFALSEQDSVGCDIERVKIIDSQKLGKIVFCSSEIKELGNSLDKTTLFFDFWTRKESFLKCIGEGFYRSAKSVDVSGKYFADKGKHYFFRTYHFADYTVSVCCEHEDFPEAIEFVDLKSIKL